jgi:hypothetical protein
MEEPGGGRRRRGRDSECRKNGEREDRKGWKGGEGKE